MTLDNDRVAVIIVSFRNAQDVRECVAALGRCNPQNFDIFVCENGGSTAFRVLCDSIVGDNSILGRGRTTDLLLYSQADAKKKFNKLVSFSLRETGISLVIAEAVENLGYAGAINIWLGLFLEQPGYTGFWILNPDTLTEPDALSELLKYVRATRKGMVGSRIVPKNDPSLIHSRGLRWRSIRAITEAVDYHAPAALEPDLERVEKLLDAPSGSSFFVTRECVERIGLMDERYFLYFEDLDWGLRAKKKNAE